MISVSQTLRAARAIIEDPAHWTTDFAARDKDGNVVTSLDRRARCFCSLGAIHRAVYQSNENYRLLPPDQLALARVVEGVAINRLQAAIDAAIDPMTVESVTHYNDTHSHEDVLAIFDAAIALREHQ
jgi:hypothetical protein